MFASIIIIVISVFLFIKYEKTVIFIAAWSLVLSVLNSGIGITFSVFQLVAIIAVLLYPFKIKKQSIENNKYPLWICVFSVGFSLFITNFYAVDKQWQTLIIHMLSIYCFTYVFWMSLRSINHIDFFLKNLIFFLIILTIYGLFEALIGTNPIIKWILDNNLANNDVGDSDRMRYGIKRIQSFLAYNGALGICCGMNFVFLLLINKYYKEYLDPYKLILLILFILLPICVFLTGTRSVILALAVGLLAIMNFNILKSKWLYLILFVGLLVTPFISEYILEVIDSFKDTSATGGSSTDLREMQFGLGIAFWFKSFWVGNGINFTQNYVMVNFSDEIFGAESIWLPLMMDRGLFGILSYIIVIFVPILLFIKNNLKPAVFIVLMFLVAKTMTSAPGIFETYHFIYVIVLLKMYEFKNKKDVIEDTAV